MLNKILEMEQELNIEGNREYTDNIIRSYQCKPTYNLKKFLNRFTDNYYDDMGFESLETVDICIDKDYNVIVTCWDEDGNQINDETFFETDRNVAFFLFMFFSMKLGEYNYDNR